MITGKVALVTGGTRGIGKAIVKKLSDAGAIVAINYTSNNEAAQQLVEEIKAVGKEALAIQCDVTSFEATKNMINGIVKQYGRLDILINNAGITMDNLLLRMKEEEFDRVIDVNLKGAFNCLKHASKIMLKQKAGKIVNISSVVGLSGNIGQCNYASSKAGLIGLTKSAAKELASRGINVNAIAPGFIDTDMTKGLSDEIKNTMLKNIPLNKFGNPEDIASMVEFLVSEKSNYITGQVISVDGGMYM